MHHNYYFLRQLTNVLRDQLLGWKLGACFSQNKDELILGFYHASNQKELFIKAHFASYFCCLQFPVQFHRAKRNSIDLFSQLLDQEITEIQQFTNERSFWLHFGEQGLLFKMHGNRANVLLTEGNQVTDVFRSSLANDYSLDISSLNRPLAIDRTTFDAVEGNIRQLYPTFGTIPLAYLQQQDYENKSPDEQWQLLQSLLTQLENPDQYLVVEWQGKLHLSLLSIGSIVAQFAESIPALNDFFLRKIKRIRLDSLKGKLLQKLEKQKKQSEQYIRKNQRTLEKLETGLQHQQIADILMANLHQISEGATEVALYDFYHDQTVTIKLNQRLSPQKNAERYYRKAKNQKIEIAQLRKNIEQKETQQIDTEVHLEHLEPLADLSKIQQYAEEYQLLSGKAEEERSFPFRVFDLDGYTVWVGKSAKNNDELLRNYSRKDDLWLHAKDVTGSHVIIKQQGNQPPPPYIIEQAAQIAAYYSKRKSDSLCPVIVTPRKYVRKSKNLPPGAVMVDREEVVMVEPKLPK
ncbi:NFACT family protein [Tunicatimonas pelagia]|uniref:NFACT family protein n=1 Tax=Tunicatimonas pelagia TaxID=931531 RepID=UPI0026666876|nr:NFACT family protein [Tunicatimonas pelagia]WKN43967.1 NFACT family protein [Tunicatimonas pelagia]